MLRNFFPSVANHMTKTALLKKFPKQFSKNMRSVARTEKRRGLTLCREMAHRTLYRNRSVCANICTRQREGARSKIATAYAVRGKKKNAKETKSRRLLSPLLATISISLSALLFLRCTFSLSREFLVWFILLFSFSTFRFCIHRAEWNGGGLSVTRRGRIHNDS